MLAQTNKFVAITGTSRSVGVQGMGGIGKTVMATALAWDEEVRQAFPDGVLWLTLGQTPQVLIEQAKLAKVLGDEQAVFTNFSEAKARLRELLANKTCLLILDDIWDLEHATAFDVLEERSQLLITTRNAGIITSLGAEEHQLSILDEQQALALLAKWGKQDVQALPAQAKEVARECGYLPLALSMVGAMLRGKPKSRWKYVLESLRDANLESIQQKFPDYPYPDLFKAIKVSVEALELEVKERYLDFAVFPEDTPIPEVVLQTFWEVEGFSKSKTLDVIDELVEKSLAQWDDTGCLRLHDLQFDYVRKQVISQNLTPQTRWGGTDEKSYNDGLGALHNRLLNAYSQKCLDGWHTLTNDGYIFQQLAVHLLAGGQGTELQRLLFDFRWLEAKLEHININALIADYDLLPHDENLQLVQGALRLSAHILAKDKTQLVEQLWGRMHCFKVPEIQTLLEQAQQNKTTWLRLLTPSLSLPGGRLLRTLIGHNHVITAVAVTPDGKHLISGSFDGVLKIWNLSTGEEVCTLTAHNGSVDLDEEYNVDLDDLDEEYNYIVNAVTVTPDGKHLISGSQDNTLKIWNLETWEKVCTLYGHSSSVNAVAVTLDSKHLISGSSDNTLKIWNLETAEEVCTLTGHSHWVTAVTVTLDGKQLISGSWDGTIKIWNLETAEEVCTLTGHSTWVSSIVITSDRKHLISGSWDDTIKIWNLETAEEVCTLTGHSDWITSVAITPDSKYLISGSSDKTLKIWNLETAGEVCTLTGHSEDVKAVAVTPDGKYVISGSSDKTLKIWKLKAAEEVCTFTGHNEYVNTVVITPDNKYVISGSSDKTLKIWNLETVEELCTLTGHSSSVDPVTVTPDSKYVISGSFDNTLKVWNVETAEEVCTFTGHSGYVRAVAVTPDGKYVISGSNDYTLKVWNLKIRKKLFTLTGHKASVHAVAVTPDGKYVISGSSDNILIVWNLKTRKKLFTLTGHSDSVEAVAVSSDGKHVISGSRDNTLKVWNLETAKEVFTLTGHSDIVWNVTFTPNDRYVISASSDNTLKVWNLQTRKVIASFIGESDMRCCAVAPDGVLIIAGEASGRIHFLRLEGV
ncbi:NB-ARC domain-containing protein [Dendronalium sp. ChiSLP03b]|uniref:NB-ARC domain-containing protein n=1 Tax=Dendronalium sp. ChiSLP03b TaxID=3075381 RepID=UPI002AD3B535|nr:NB-ARC domain-containing protein [Dendronalium sp. ChiSLP03b]MDZ8207025.1 NB-ARC domain-containing protein [Dendronalium sp. ChiSLP03b]